MLGLSSSLTGPKKPLYGKANSATTFTSSSSDYISLSNHTDFQVKSAAGVASDFSVCGWVKIRWL